MPIAWIEQATLCLQSTRNNHYAKQADVHLGRIELPTSSFLSIRIDV